MTIEKVREGMLNALDWEVHDYGNYEDARVKKVIANEYQAKARAYNTLMNHLFGIDALLDTAFPKQIEDYIDDRKYGRWEKVGG